MVIRRGTGGRPSKGPRDAMRLRPSVELGAILRANAAAAEMTNGDYCISLLAQEIDRTHIEPGTGNLAYIGPLDSIFVRPPIDLAVAIREAADAANMSIASFCSVLLANAIGRTDLAVLPTPPSQEVLPLHRTG
ncbi:MAG: hypothetical protein GX678_04325 [Actinomycetales bacterium]|nr:hypothetical protein [Actinomycetales bacterium]